MVAHVVVPMTWEAEAAGLMEPGSSRPTREIARYYSKMSTFFKSQRKFGLKSPREPFVRRYSHFHVCELNHTENYEVVCKVVSVWGWGAHRSRWDST